MAIPFLLMACRPVPPPVPVPLPSYLTNIKSPCEDLAIASFPKEFKTNKKTYFSCKPGVFALNYNPENNTAIWVIQSIKKEDLESKTGIPARTELDDKRLDPDVPEERSANLDDFIDNGYETAFFAGLQSYLHDDIKYSHAQYLTNAFPIHADRVDIWNKISELAIETAKITGEVKVISGTLYEEGKGIEWVGKSTSNSSTKEKIHVPSHVYKIIYSVNNNDYFAFVVPNKKIINNEPPALKTDWKTLEEMSGISFAPDLSDEIKRKIYK